MTRNFLMAAVLAALCAAGCSSAPSDAPVAKTDSSKEVAGKSGNNESGAAPGLNPGYHSTAAQDDAKIGGALKGK